MKRKNNTKKNLLYCSLAICLIAGVWKLTSLGISNSDEIEDRFGDSYDMKARDNVDNSTDRFENTDSSLATDSKNSDGKRSGIDIVNDLEKKETKNSDNELSNFRSSFDVEDPEDVKKAQRILQNLGYTDIKEDGLFGPKTEAAWKLALSKLDNNESSNTGNIASVSNTQPEMEKKPIEAKTSTNNLTTLNSTKATVPSNNSMLD